MALCCPTSTSRLVLFSLLEQVWKREVPGSAFVAIKSSATLAATPQALFEVLTPGDIEIVRQVGDRERTACRCEWSVQHLYSLIRAGFLISHQLESMLFR